MARSRRLEFILDAMVDVQRRTPDVCLLMVGSGDSAEDVDQLKRMSERNGLRHAIFTGPVERARIPAFIRAANVVVSPINPVPLFLWSSPTKLVETLAMARPLVANDTPEQKQVLTESGGGLCVPYNQRAFADAITWLLQHPREAAEMGKKGRHYVERERSLDAQADQLEGLYRRLIAEARDRRRFVPTE